MFLIDFNLVECGSSLAFFIVLHFIIISDSAMLQHRTCFLKTLCLSNVSFHNSDSKSTVPSHALAAL